MKLGKLKISHINKQNTADMQTLPCQLIHLLSFLTKAKGML